MRLQSLATRMFTKSHSIKVDRVLYVKILINNEKMMIQLFIFQNFISNPPCLKYIYYKCLQ